MVVGMEELVMRVVRNCLLLGGLGMGTGWG